jgi:hypothetical protein
VQPPDEGGEDCSVRPVDAWSWVGAAKDGDLVPQHEELDVLGGGRATQQQDQPEQLSEDQIGERSDDTAMIVPEQWSAAMTAGHRRARHSGTPQVASFSRIHRRNLIMQGIVPLLFPMTPIGSG